MKQKLCYIMLGYFFTAINFALIETRFTLVGMGFGILAAIFFIKSLFIKK